MVNSLQVKRTCEFYIGELGEVSSSVESLQFAHLFRKVLLVRRSCIYNAPRRPERAKEANIYIKLSGNIREWSVNGFGP